MPNLQRRLRAHRRRKAIKNRIVKQLKKQSMQAFSILVIMAMICTLIMPPAAVAYFTGDTKRSETLALVITRDPENAAALIEFLDGFIMEKDSISSNEEKTVQTFSTSSLTLNEEPPHETDAPVSTSEIISEPDTLKVLIRLDDGFDAGDIYIPSLEIQYQGHTALALAGELNQEGNLLAEFNRAEIAAWFKDSTDQIEAVTFDVTGDGYEEGLYPFHFTGLGTINISGSYETKSTAILGPNGFLIPEDGEAVSETYRLVNQDGTHLEGAEWALETSVPGVRIDAVTGVLTVQHDAAEGDVIITSIIERESRVHKARKSVAICRDPGLAIVGDEKILIPYPGEYSNTAYELKTQNDVELDNITWEVAEGIEGVTVDPTGTVVVDGTAAEGSFTLVAGATLKGIPLTAETTVVLENMPEPVVMAAPQTTTDTLLISGEDLILIPKVGESSFTYTTADLDSNPLDDVNWLLVGEIQGVTLSGSTLTVTCTAGEGTVTLEATSETISEENVPNLLTGKKIITLAHPAPNAVEITGPASITIPAPGSEGEAVQETYHYTATVLDQLGNILDGEEVTWELAEQPAGISPGADGELIVSSGAEAGTVTLLARAAGNDEISGTLIIELVEGEAEPPAGGALPIGEDEAIKEDEVVDDGLVDENPAGGGSGGDGTDEDTDESAGEGSDEAGDPADDTPDGDTSTGTDDAVVPGDEEEPPASGEDEEAPSGEEEDPLDDGSEEQVQDGTETGEQPEEGNDTGEEDAVLPGEEDTASQPEENGEATDPAAGEDTPPDGDSEEQNDTETDAQPEDGNDTGEEDAVLPGEEDATSQPGEDEEATNPAAGNDTDLSEPADEEDTGTIEQPTDNTDDTTTEVDDTDVANGVSDSPDTDNEDAAKDTDSDDTSSDAGSETIN